MRKLTLIFCLFISLKSFSQTFSLVKEINTTANLGGIFSSNFSKVGNTIFIVATTPQTGAELWKYDAGTGTTTLVKDIWAGTTGSGIGLMTEAGGLLYFTANDGFNGAELWRSNGTEAGTYIVKNIAPGNSSAAITTLFYFNGSLFFPANDGSTGLELWKSDGTEVGTIKVKEIAAGSVSAFAGASPNEFTSLGGFFYFPANNITNGRELWKSDGTEAGTVIVKDVAAGASGSIVNHKAAAFDNKIFFAASNGTSVNGTELWATDGNDIGTYMVKDIVVGTGNASPNNLTPFNGALYFTASPTNNTNPDLWKTDGTDAGTVMVKNLAADGVGLTIGFNNANNLFTVLDSKLFFTSLSGPVGGELYVTDGTAAGTVLVKDIAPGSTGSTPSSPRAFNGKLYFSAFDLTGVPGRKLFVSDGTSAGTYQVAAGDLESRLYFSGGNLIPIDDALFFSGSTIDEGLELWKTDGTSAGTLIVQDINLAKNGTNTSGVSSFGSATLGNTYFFAAADDTHGMELWKSDGTDAGTVMIKDIRPGKSNSNPFNFFKAGGIIYFTAADEVSGTELWRTDGTQAGTIMVKDIWPGAFSSTPSRFTLSNGKVFFTAEDPVNGREIWLTDGTPGGTILVADVTPGIGNGMAAGNDAVTVGNYAYFIAASGLLYKADGVANSFLQVPSDIIANDLCSLGTTLFITGRNPSSQTNLWKSENGATPVLIKMISPTLTTAYQLTACANKVYFNASNGTSGQEPWVSDGTAAGTFLIKDINPGSGASQPFQFVASHGKVYFQASNAANNIELWATDGTEAGTYLVKDIFPGATNNGFPSAMIAKQGGNILFVATDGVSGVELWESNGTAPGTNLKQDFNTNGDGFSIPGRFLNFSQDYLLTKINNDNNLLFFARSADKGLQLYTGSIAGNYLYVNDNSQANDALTTAIGSNANNGSQSAPFATLTFALTQASEGDTIYVDAGSYAEQVIIDKGITIIGAGQNLTSFTPPATTLVPAPGPFTEIGLFETTQGIGDVHISDLAINSNNASQNIIIQSGGSVKNCRLLNGGQGVFFRIQSTVTTALVENNIIEPQGIGVNCQGSGLTAIIRNNNISRSTGYFAGIFAGLDFGPLPQLTINNNLLTNTGFFGIGMEVNSYNGNYNLNSIVGFPLAIRTYNTGNTPNATCNWFGSTDGSFIASKISGGVNYSPWLTNGTDNSAAIGFQPVNAACSGRNSYYVNNNSLTGDVFTSAIGNNSNNGSASAPFATISYALTQAAADDYIYVDAGTYTEQVTTDKGITIIGASQNLTSILKPAVTSAPPGSFMEHGVIQTAQSIIGDVHISHLSVTGTFNPGVTPIIIQSGGSVKNCKLQNGNQGIFVRIDPNINLATKTFVIDGNTIDAEYIPVNFAGTRLTGILTNNTLAGHHPDFSTGVFAGLDFGTLAGLTVTGNKFSSFVTDGLLVNTNNGTITQNSFTGVGPKAINRVGGGSINATCNWYGSPDQNVVVPKLTGGVNYTPWLTNGTDNNAAIGFQPVAGSCTGRQNKFYVNDNNLTGNVYTTAVGNDNNSGVPSSPLATLATAISRASAGDSIFVDAGDYTIPNITISKAIWILGPNHSISPNDATDKTKYNTGRNAEARLMEGSLIMGADWIFMNGLRFTPTTAAISLNADYSHIKFSNNYFDVAGAASTVSLQGVTSTPAIVSFDFMVTNNRFERIDNGTGNMLLLGNVSSLWIDNNAFVESGISVNRSFALRTSNVQLVNGLFFSNNFLKKLNQGVITFALQNSYIYTNTFDSCSQGVNYTPSFAVSNNVSINGNTFNNLRIGRSVLVRGGSAAGINNLNINDNTINQEVNGINGIVSMIQLDFAAANNYGTVNVRANKINISGDYNFNGIGTNCGIILAGRHSTTNVESNEINFTAINSRVGASAGVLPPVPAGIFLNTDALPATAVLNIANNKINGFKQSIAFYDPIAGANTTTGYGYLANGILATITNNSFTNDSISIDNGTTSQLVNATCNWYSSSASQNVATKITQTTVTHLPWLTNGTDTDVATGFQPVPNSCNGVSVDVDIVLLTNVTCNGAANGSIDVLVEGGVAPFTHAWYKDGVAGYSILKDLTNLAPGDYKLIVTDANGSLDSVFASISEPDVLTATAGGSNNVCYNGSIGSSSVLPTGGTAPYTYLWSNGETTEEISNLIAGIYSVTVTDANGCTSIASYEVTQPSQVTASIANSSTACSNIATVTAGGGTPGYSYLWSNGATSATISGVPVGSYTVTVTDDNGCTATANVSLTISEAFNPSASVTNVTCFGANDGIITVTNVNGTAPFMFSKNGGVSFVNGTLPFSFNNLAPGTYNIAVQDATGCTGFVERIVTQPTQLTTSHTVQNTCAGVSTGSINVTVNGGTPAYSYSWTGLNGAFTSTQLNINNLAAGNYTLTITDKNNCTVVVPVTVNPFPAIVIARTITDVACKGGATGSINITVIGGTGSGFSYSWTGGIISANEDLNNITKGSYKIRVTDNGSGCFVDSTFTVNEPATSLSLTTVKTNATGCNSLGTITATGSGGTAPYQYKIDNGVYQTSGSFAGIYAGNYTVWVKDANGCTTTKVAAITDNGSDEYESNNSKNQAKLISIGTTVGARIALSTDIADWFKFTTPAGSANYTVTLNHSTVNYTFNVYAAGNNTPALVPVSSSPTAKQYLLAGGATYFIQITGQLSFTCYQLSVNTQMLTQSGNSGSVKEDTMAEPIVAELSAKVFPNPHQGNFNIVVQSPAAGMGMVELFTITGQKVTEKKSMLMKSGSNTIPFSGIRQQVLIYKVTVGNKSVTGKIIGFR